MPALANLQHQLEGWGQRPAPQRVAAAAACLAAAASLAAALPRLPQPESYHSFAGDHRSLPGIPHAPNVLSNAAIAAAGVLGLAHLWRRWAGGSGRVRARRAAPAALAAEPAAARKSEDEASAEQEAANRAAAGFGGSPGKARLWAVAFAGMVAAGAGSAYYHWAPSTPRLAADQLGMSLAFAWLALAVVVDRRGPPRRALGWAAAAAGATAAPAAALHWLHSELAGAGNLRWYGLAQALTGGRQGLSALFFALCCCALHDVPCMLCQPACFVLLLPTVAE